MAFAITVVCAILQICLAQQTPPERHSLYYVYTALSKAVNAPGIFEFTAMGLLDDRKIDYYNSEKKAKIPQQDWMKEKLPADYWEKGTLSRRSKEQWFKVNVNILMERMNQNNSDIHVLMWKHGCEIVKRPDGSFMFEKGIDAYSYDGRDFLSFDDTSMQWVAPVSEAVPTKQKWDGVPILNQYTKGYLEKECVDWLEKFRGYGEEETQAQMKAIPPVVRLFAKENTSPETLLTCMATGFYPKDIDITILREKTVMKKGRMEDVMPNGDGTHQIRLSVKALGSELDVYRCEVNHRGLKETIQKSWKNDGELCNVECPSCVGGAVIGVVFGGLVGILMLLVILVFLGLNFGIIERNGYCLQLKGKPVNNPVKSATDSDSGKGSDESNSSSSTEMLPKEVQ